METGSQTQDMLFIILLKEKVYLKPVGLGEMALTETK